LSVIVTIVLLYVALMCAMSYGGFSGACKQQGEGCRGGGGVDWCVCRFAIEGWMDRWVSVCVRACVRARVSEWVQYNCCMLCLEERGGVGAGVIVLPPAEPILSSGW
jgi:hypothetical protein